MVLPLHILESSKNKRITVETNDGANFTGYMLACDKYMNVHISPVIHTSKSKGRSWRADECFIRGCNIKSIILPDEALEEAFDKESKIQEWRRSNNLLSGYREHCQREQTRYLAKRSRPEPRYRLPELYQARPVHDVNEDDDTI